jgi:hypothetical protein
VRRRQQPYESQDEDAFPPEQVSDTPAEQQQSSKGQGVSRHYPGAIGISYTEIGLGSRQRDIDDRDVEYDHQGRRSDNGQC